MKMGLRIYYARYPEAGSGSSRPQLNGSNPDYLNRHTVFMVPTYDKSTNGDLPIDFDPDYYDTLNCVYKNIRISRGDSGLTFPKQINALGGFATQQVVSNSRAMNHGSICPPVCKPPAGAVFIQ